MRDAELQVCEDALHAVEGLLPGCPQVFLHGSGHWGEDGLSRLPGIHHLSWVLWRRGSLVLVETLDVSKGLFHRHDQPEGWRKARFYFCCLLERYVSEESPFKMRFFLDGQRVGIE